MKKIIKLIKNTKKDSKILICSHINCDFDAFYSSCALAQGLKHLGFTNVTVLLNEASDLIYSKAKYLVKDLKFSDNENQTSDLFFVLDLNDEKRLGKYSKTFYNSKNTAIIDHHINLKLKCDATYSIPEYSSTSELVYNVLNKLKALDKFSATYLYLGIRSDTVNFKALCTPNTLIAASNCIKYGFDMCDVIDKVSLKTPENDFNFITKMYAKTKCENGLKNIVVNEDEMKKYNINKDALKEKIIAICQEIEGIKVLCVMLNIENKIYGSLRSYSEMNIEKLAKSLGGGGHDKASGFENTLSIDENIKVIKQYYEDNKKVLK